MTRYADDLALAHVLADTADSISMARFRAQDLQVTEKPGRMPLAKIKVMKDDPVAVEAQAEEIKARYSKYFGV